MGYARISSKNKSINQSLNLVSGFSKPDPSGLKIESWDVVPARFTQVQMLFPKKYIL